MSIFGINHGLPLYVPRRFAKWKRDAKYWFAQDSLMFERLLGKVADDLVRFSLLWVSEEVIS